MFSFLARLIKYFYLREGYSLSLQRPDAGIKDGKEAKSLKGSKPGPYP